MYVSMFLHTFLCVQRVHIVSLTPPPTNFTSNFSHVAISSTSKSFPSARPVKRFAPPDGSQPVHKYQRWYAAVCETARPLCPDSSSPHKQSGQNNPLHSFVNLYPSKDFSPPSSRHFFRSIPYCFNKYVQSQTLSSSSITYRSRSSAMALLNRS